MRALLSKIPTHGDRTAWASALKSAALVAAAYAISGRLALMLAIPPGYATAIWPAAGFALAGMLLWGDGAWPGVLIGSFLVNVWTSFDATTSAALTKSLLLPASIGLGATLEALIGAYLVRLFIAEPTKLDSEWDIVRLLGLGGPAAATVNATWGMLSLMVAGYTHWSDFAFGWFTWWVGDAIGVIIFTPLALVWIGRHGAGGLRRRLVVTLPLCFTFALAVVFFGYASRWQQARISSVFRERTDIAGRTIEVTFAGYMDVLQTIASFYASSPEVSRRSFHVFTEPMFLIHPGIQALEWIPRVPQNERDAYEQAARQDGCQGFQFTQSDLRGGMVREGSRAEYFPVYYMEPYKTNKEAFGFDVASSPMRYAALAEARDTGDAVATRGIRLVQEKKSQFGLLIFLPIYTRIVPHESIEQRRQTLRGYALAVFRVGDVVRSALQGTPLNGIRIRLYDAAPFQTGQLLFDSQWRDGARHPSGTAASQPRAALQRITSFQMARRSWKLEFLLPQSYLDAHRSWEAWGFLTASLLFTGVLGVLLLVITGRAERTEELVRQRTTEIVERDGRLRAVVQSATDGIVTGNSDGIIVDFNRGAELIFGYSVQELLGRPLTVLMPERFHDAHNRGMARYLATGEARIMGRRAEFVGRRKDGREFPLEMSLSTWKTSQGRFFTGILRDISERKEAETRLSRQAKDLERSNADLSQFAHIASHDLQEPLRMVGNYTQLLARKYKGRLDADADEFINFAVDGVTRMQTLIHDLLSYSQVATQGKSFQAVDSAKAFDHALCNLEIAIEESGATVTHGQLPVVIADGSQLTQLFQNLVGNAIKYRYKEPPCIHAAARGNGAEWIFSLRDNGIGIDPHYAEKIFVIFQRLHSRREYAGTGIGLSICKKIVERHGGKIWVESEPGKGATFFFTLPYKGQDGNVEPSSMTAKDDDFESCRKQRSTAERMKADDTSRSSDGRR